MPEAARQSEIDPYRSIVELHRLTGRSPRLIRERLAEVPFQPGPQNQRRYHAPTVLPLIMASNAREDMTYQRARLAKAQADVTEIQRDEYRAALVPADVVRGYWQDTLQNTESRLRRLPKECASAVRGVRELNLVEHKLREAVERALNDLADFVPDSRE